MGENRMNPKQEREKQEEAERKVEEENRIKTEKLNNEKLKERKDISVKVFDHMIHTEDYNAEEIVDLIIADAVPNISWVA